MDWNIQQKKLKEQANLTTTDQNLARQPNNTRFEYWALFNQTTRNVCSYYK